ncbi:MAG TPA: IclR family transcriptional regulator [Thermoleophilia bacterium]|nr:IclR family transcriptional regulator [Thermoleophilia bacterium]
MTPTKKSSPIGRDDLVGKVAEMGNETDPFLVRALARGLSILRLFDVDHREWTIDEMAEQTGLLRMTVYRMVRTLESLAFLVRDPVTNRYRLGPATLAMTYVSEDQSDLVQLARPFLESLLEATGESVTLAIEVDGIPVCADIVNTTRPFKRRTAPGRIIGDIASVQGKLFAAFKPPAEIESVLSRIHPRLTPNTIIDPAELAAEFEQIRLESVAVDIEGLYLNTCAVGAPIRDQLGNVIAAIAVVVPTGRFGPEEREHCRQAVMSTAMSLSAYLGWNQGTGATA